MYPTYLVQKTGFCVYTKQMRTSLLILLPSLLSLSRINRHGDKYSCILASVELMNWTLFGQIQSEYLPCPCFHLFSSLLPFLLCERHMRNIFAISNRTNQRLVKQHLQLLPPRKRFLPPVENVKVWRQISLWTAPYQNRLTSCDINMSRNCFVVMTTVTTFYGMKER